MSGDVGELNRSPGNFITDEVVLYIDVLTTLSMDGIVCQFDSTLVISKQGEAGEICFNQVIEDLHEEFAFLYS